MDETFSSIDLVTQCMMDQKRTDKFREAIERAVQPGDIVLDSGTGSAILALFAARAGAKKVIAVEYDPYVAQLAVKNIEANGFAGVIEVFVGDIRNMHFAEGTRFDVVIMEMLTTGMIDEYQVWAINNLHERGLVTPQTRFVPARQDTYLALTETDFTNYELSMRMVKHHWDPYPMWKMRELAKPTLISSISFDRQNSVDFSRDFEFEILEDGTLNSVYFTSTTAVDSVTEVGATLAMNAPVSVPLEEDISVSKGDVLILHVSYSFGNGFRNLHLKASKQTK